MSLPKTFNQPWYFIPIVGTRTAKIFDSLGQIVAEGIEVSDAANIVAAMHEKYVPKENGFQTGICFVVIDDDKNGKISEGKPSL